MKKKLKGQFFVLGAILIVTLFFVGLPKPYPLTQTRSSDMVYIFKNLEREYPIALNLGLNESDPVNTLMNFTWFADRVMDEHMINFTVLWIITETTNETSEDLNITIGNFLGHDTIIKVVIVTPGEPSSWTNVTINNNSTNSTYRGPPSPAVAQTFNLTITIFSESETKAFTYQQREKVNFYALISIERDENVIRAWIES